MRRDCLDCLDWLIPLDDRYLRWIIAEPADALVVSSPRPLQELTQLADKLVKQPLESVSGVGQIQIVVGAARQIQIHLDPDKMLAHVAMTSSLTATMTPR